MSYSEAFSCVSEFYATKAPSAGTLKNNKSNELMAIVTGFPKRVVIALAMSIRHLSIFGLADALLEAQFFEQFTQRTHMLLNSNTLANLEIYRNQTDFTTHGSLMWALDKTHTRFGARLLQKWLGKPLIDPV
jgi:DNA mismatch repair protein MSH3